MKWLSFLIPPFIKKSEFGVNALFYSSSSFITGAMSFILITVLTSLLSKKDFGVFENFTAISTLLTGIILWGNDFNVIQFYKSDSKKTEYIQAINVILCQFLLLMILALFINISFLKVSRLVVIAAVVFSTISALSQLINISYQYEKRAKLYAIIAVSGSALSVLLNIILVYVLKDYWGRIIATVLSAFIVLIIILIPFRNQKLKSFSFNLKHLRSAYLIGLPFFIGLVAGWALEKVNRFMISDMISLDEAGVFGVGYQFGAIVLIIKAAITRAWMPYVIENATDGKHQIKKMLRKLFLAFFILALSVSLFSYFYIEFFINEKFLRSQLIVPFISLAYCLDGIWSLYVNIIVYEKKYKIYTTITIIAGTINVIINYFFIPRWGIIGSAIATLISFGFGALLSYLYVKYLLKWFNKQHLQYQL